MVLFFAEYAFKAVAISGEAVDERYAPPSIRDRILPKVVSGDCILAICMTEPHAGTDVANYRTNADIVGDKLVLNGVKPRAYLRSRRWDAYDYVKDLRRFTRYLRGLDRHPARVSLLIGPEGGFEPAEVALADAEGAVHRVGNMRLTTEAGRRSTISAPITSKTANRYRLLDGLPVRSVSQPTSEVLAMPAILLLPAAWIKILRL